MSCEQNLLRVFSKKGTPTLHKLLGSVMVFRLRSIRMYEKARVPTCYIEKKNAGEMTKFQELP